jgi:hypothetical protein
MNLKIVMIDVAICWMVIGACLGLKKILEKLPRYIVAIEFENPLLVDGKHGTMRHLFFIRADKSLRGDENYAKQFWTERSAQLAAAEWKLTDQLSEDKTLRLIQVRIMRIRGL